MVRFFHYENTISSKCFEYYIFLSFPFVISICKFIYRNESSNVSRPHEANLCRRIPTRLRYLLCDVRSSSCEVVECQGWCLGGKGSQLVQSGWWRWRSTNANYAFCRFWTGMFFCQCVCI